MSDASTDFWGLPGAVIQSLQAVMRAHPEVDRGILYGSRAMGAHRPGSDIDLALVAPTADLTALMKIENEIDDLLLPYKVDLCLIAHIENAALREHIARVGVAIFERI